ncbi:MAG TPA: hypothetical protein DCY79_12110 [Planctomycetaceae bacterium]|nr:hypothetical protein [Blastopirellula sp.]HAY80541.1 hypothetical protein [Planctomycetaceae bacterium]
MHDDSDRSQAPTPRRRQRAREQGHVVKSQDLASSLAFLGALGGLYYFGGDVLHGMAQLLERGLRGQFDRTGRLEATVDTWREAGIEIGIGLLPLFAVFLVVALVSNLGQTGWLFLPGKASIDPSRVNPWNGLSRVFSLRGSARLGFGLTKTLVASGVAGWFLWRHQSDILNLPHLQGVEIGTRVATLFFAASLQVGFALLILSALDYGFEYWQHEQDLQMTPQEVLEELKSIEGDPEVRARQRQQHRQSSSLPTTQERITFIVFSPAGALALRYVDDEMTAPVIVNKGTGDNATRIQQNALSQNVPCISSQQLSSHAISTCEIGNEVPSQLYYAVAQAWQRAHHLPVADARPGQTVAQHQHAF